jgi:hypothetical protein
MALPILFCVSIIIVELWTWSQPQQQPLPILNKIQTLKLCSRENCTNISDFSEKGCFYNFIASNFSSACENSVKWFFLKDNVKIIKVKNTEFSSCDIVELDK